MGGASREIHAAKQKNTVNEWPRNYKRRDMKMAIVDERKQKFFRTLAVYVLVLTFSASFGTKMSSAGTAISEDSTANASGYESTAVGDYANASGAYATANGYSAQATADNSTADGSMAVAPASEAPQSGIMLRP